MNLNREELTQKLQRLNLATEDVKRRGQMLSDPFEKENILQQKAKKTSALKKQNDHLERILESAKVKNGGMCSPRQDGSTRVVRSRAMEDLQAKLRFVQSDYLVVQRELREAEKKLREEEAFADKTAKLVRRKSASPASPIKGEEKLTLLEKHKTMLAHSLIQSEKRYLSQKKELDRMIHARRETLEEVQNNVLTKEDQMKKLMRKITQKEHEQSDGHHHGVVDNLKKFEKNYAPKSKKLFEDFGPSVEKKAFVPSADELSAEIRNLKQRMRN